MLHPLCLVYASAVAAVAKPGTPLAKGWFGSKTGCRRRRFILEINQEKRTMQRCCRQGCTKYASYSAEGSRTAEFCALHVKEGVLNVSINRKKRCRDEGCSKKPSQGTEGSKAEGLCEPHMKKEVADANGERCSYQGCMEQPSYGVGIGGSKTAQFCARHSKEGMVHVCKQMRCAHQGCTKLPSYGTEGSKIAQFCAPHAKERMVNVFSKRCTNQGCTKHPSCGAEGSKTAQSCAPHAQGGIAPHLKEEMTPHPKEQEGMVNVYKYDKHDEGFANQGWIKRTNYDKEGGSTKAELCAPNAKERLVNVLGKRCAYQSCSKHPTYGIEDSKTVQFCAPHAKEGMVYIRKKTCVHQGCTKHPTYGTEGSKAAQFCAPHAKEGMINIHKKKRCAHQGCPKHPSYGTEGISKTAEFCAPHAKEGMVNVFKKCCAHQGCTKHPSYSSEGSKTAEFCAPHAKEGMVSFYYKRFKRHPSYGEEESNKAAELFFPHAKEEMVNICDKTCSHQGYTKYPSYGIEDSNVAELCAPHAKDGIVNVFSVGHPKEGMVDIYPKRRLSDSYVGNKRKRAASAADQIDSRIGEDKKWEKSSPCSFRREKVADDSMEDSKFALPTFDTRAFPSRVQAAAAAAVYQGEEAPPTGPLYLEPSAGVAVKTETVTSQFWKAPEL